MQRKRLRRLIRPGTGDERALATRQSSRRSAMSLSVTTQADIEQSLHHIFADVIDGGDYSAIDRYFVSDYVDHSAMGDLRGTEAFSGMLEGFRAALPGFR